MAMTPAGTNMPDWYGQAPTVTTPAGTTLPSNYGQAPPKPKSSSKKKSSGSSSHRSSGSSSSSSSHHRSSGGGGGGGASYSGHSNGGSSGGKSTGSNSTGQVSTMAAQPTIPSASDYLGKDSTYLAQQAQIQKALADYRAQMGQQEDQYNGDFASRVNDFGIRKTQAVTDQGDDYASRGMYVSGLYGKANSDLLGQFSRQAADMEAAKANWFAGVNNDYANYQDEQGIAMTKAKQDAMARRASQYGLTTV